MLRSRLGLEKSLDSVTDLTDAKVSVIALDGAASADTNTGEVHVTIYAGFPRFIATLFSSKRLENGKPFLPLN